MAVRLNDHISSPGWENVNKLPLILAKHSLGEASLLFEKIEDGAIETQQAKLIP